MDNSGYLCVAGGDPLTSRLPPICDTYFVLLAEQYLGGQARVESPYGKNAERNLRSYAMSFCAAKHSF